jgi:hypothetical protein
MVEYYSPVRENEILAFAAKWMEPENIMLWNNPDTERWEPPILCHM